MKTTDNLNHCLRMDAEPGTRSRQMENLGFLSEAERREKAKKELRTVETVKEAVNILRKMRGLSWDQLAVEIGVTRTTLMGWLEGKTIRFQHVVSICVALHLHGDLGRRLITISECRTRIVPNRELYWYMIDMATVLDVDHCNEILALAKLPPLHCGEGCS